MEFLMDTLVGRQANKATSLLSFSAPTYAQVRQTFVAGCAPSIDSRWSAPITSPARGLRSSRRITTRCSTGSSSGRPYHGNCVFSLRRSSGDPDCSPGCSTDSAQSGLRGAVATISRSRRYDRRSMPNRLW